MAYDQPATLWREADGVLPDFDGYAPGSIEIDGEGMVMVLDPKTGARLKGAAVLDSDRQFWTE